ncbi:MAG: ABC transporter ATP-binding protein/permease [Microscillaceae bacterium]|nr:ABC transporter ATP-binding protein/permease [Microscillaceae bacterium]MDW8461121.1 ABC transporter ATP-binding protein [Cytophagales bacterium]
MKPLQHLNKYFWKYRAYLFWGTIFTIISNIFSIASAPLVRYAFDLVKETLDIYFSFQNSQAQAEVHNIFAYSVVFYGFLIVLMAVLRGIFLFFVRQTLIVMSRHIEYDLKNEIYAHYQTLPLSFYRQHNTGDLMARISEDVSQVRMYVGPGIMYGISLVTLTSMVIAYMFYINAELAFYTLLPLPFLSISIYYVSYWIEKRSDEIQKVTSDLSTHVQEAFSGIRVIKSFVREEDNVKEFSKKSEEYKQKSLKLAHIESTFYPLMIALIGLSTVFTVYVGGIQVIQGHITEGNIAEFIIYINMLVWPVTSLGWVISIVQRAVASQKRINEFLEIQTDIVSEKNIEKEILGNIRFENVTFRYADSGIVALKNISFEVKQGTSLAILGSTGSGKSTIANLLCRMYDTTEGTIWIDEYDIKDYHVQTLRKQIGYVPQDVFLFSDTIQNNITFGLSPESVSQEAIIQAAKDADLYKNIMDFPHQFETRIGERGITLSGGQKQRLSIARAIVRNPKIMILDDSLSAVDTKTENAILNNLQRIMQNRTTIIISHRVSSAKLADQIIVLDDGKIVEQGTHESLLAQNGIYKTLYEKQLQTEPEEAE